MKIDSSIIFFFFQAEDGIRDYKVTGVQTCALPISGIFPFEVRPIPAATAPPMLGRFDRLPCLLRPAGGKEAPRDFCGDSWQLPGFLLVLLDERVDVAQGIGNLLQREANRANAGALCHLVRVYRPRR